MSFEGESKSLQEVLKAAKERAIKVQRRMAYSQVLIPTLGFITAIFLFWYHPIGPLELGLLLVMYLLTFIGITSGFHRLFAHTTYQASTLTRALLAILGSMAVQGPVIWWAAVHRHHHSCSDHPGDPHSPYLSGKGLYGSLRGLYHAHMEWMFVYDGTDDDWGRYVPDLIRDNVIFKINQYYFLWVFLGLGIPAFFGGILTGSWMGFLYGLLWGGLVRIFIVHHTTWAINSICHSFGKRPFDNNDRSGNNMWLALITLGEAWHNNHHAFPSSAKFGLKWWQIDIGAGVVRLLEKFGLAWDVKIPTTQMIQKKLKKGIA